MAGLPKAASVLLVSLGLMFLLAVVATAEDLQTGSVVLPPGGVQTGSNVLQPVFDLIDVNLNADSIDQQALKDDFQAAADLLLITADQALAMLGLVDWETLVEPNELANAAAIQTILDGLIAGEPIGDPVVALQVLLYQLATPAGTLNALERAGASDETLAEVASLVASGVPPGIVVRITKQGLRNGLSPEESSAQLEVVAAAVAEGGDVS